MLPCTILMNFFSSCFLCSSTFHRNLYGHFFIMNSSIPDQKVPFALGPIRPTSSSSCKPQPTKHGRVMLLTYFLHLTSRLTNYRWLRSSTHRSRRTLTSIRLQWVQLLEYFLIWKSYWVALFLKKLSLSLDKCACSRIVASKLVF